MIKRNANTYTGGAPSPIGLKRCFSVFYCLVVPCLLGMSQAEAAEPYRPLHDGIVLERLPWRTDGDTRRLGVLRKALADRPGDATAAVALARHAFLLAVAHGDPRWAGMGEAALKPWWDQPDAAVDVIYHRALLKQYRHEFDAALADLALAARADPTRADILSWRVAIHLIQANPEAARGDCEKMALGGNTADLRDCRAWIAGVSGNAREAYAAFGRIAAANLTASTGTRRWISLQLAENALRLGLAVDAEKHLRAARALPGPDHVSLIALADLLLDQGRFREVDDLLEARFQSDSALLRRALARRALKDERWKSDAARLAQRYDAARLRGEALRENEEAWLQLGLLDNPKLALALAQSNWRVQREPIDARILLECAIAAGDVQAAEPVLQWLARLGIEEPRLVERARSLRPRG